MFESTIEGAHQTARKRWPASSNGSFLIGDNDDDMAAAAAFNIRGIKFNSATDSLSDLVRRQLAPQAERGR